MCCVQKLRISWPIHEILHKRRRRKAHARRRTHWHRHRHRHDYSFNLNHSHHAPIRTHKVLCAQMHTHTMNYKHTRSTVCADIHTQDVLLVCVCGRWRSHIGSHVFFSKRMTHNNHNHDNIHTHTHTHTLDKSYRFASVLQMLLGAGRWSWE